MLLMEYVRQYLDSRDVSAGYRAQVKSAILAMEKFTGHPLSLADLSVDLLNRYLSTTRSSLSPETRKHRRAVCLTIWRAAADDELVPAPRERKVMRVRVPEKLHTAWSPEQVRQLLTAADQLRGRIFQNGVDQGRYWRSYVMAAWDSGLRGCDLRQLRREDITARGLVVLIQQKTGRRLLSQFRMETVDAIEATYPPDRPAIWAICGGLRLWRDHARRLVARAGLTGGIGRLRHSSGTAVELLHPGRGHEHLGNTRRVFEQHYLDHDRAFVAKPMPERLV